MSISRRINFKDAINKWRVWLVIGIIATCLVIVFFSPSNNWAWDPSFYYAQLRSPIIENNLDFRNETFSGNYDLGYTVTGLQPSLWPVGPSILWSPFFLIAHFIVNVFDPKLADGYIAPYISLVGFGSMMYGALGLAVIYKICRRYASRFLSIIATVLSLAATPLLFYMFQQPIMAHTAGLFASAAMLYVYLILEEEQLDAKYSGIVFGVFLGLNFLTRWAGIIIAVVPGIYYAYRIIEAYRIRRHNLRVEALQIGILLITFFLTVSPQLTLWYRLHGKILVSPQGAASFVESIFPTNIWKVLIDTNRGVLFWAPFVAIGLVGMFWIKPPRLRLVSLLYCFLSIVLIGYRKDWFSGGGYGARYFIEMLPFVTIGFVALTNRLSKDTFGRIVITLGSIVLIFHQMTLFYTVQQSYNLKWIDLQDYTKGRPLGLRWQFDSFVRIAKSPDIWFLPRIDTRTDRQSILINLVNHITDVRAYLTQALVVFLTPVAIGLFAWINHKFKPNYLPLLSLAILLLMIVWAFGFLLIG